jgi:cell division cycle 2-like protein
MSPTDRSPSVKEPSRKRMRTRSPQAEQQPDGEAELVRIKKRLIKIKQLRERGTSFGGIDHEDEPTAPDVGASTASILAAGVVDTAVEVSVVEDSRAESPGFRILGSSTAGSNKPAEEEDIVNIDVPKPPMPTARTLPLVMPRSHLAPPRNQHPSLSSCRSVYSYTRLNHIEEGAYGIVFRARCNDTGGIYALKKLKLEEEKQGFPITSLREVMALMVTGGHDNVVGVREIVVGDTLNQ